MLIRLLLAVLAVSLMMVLAPSAQAHEIAPSAEMSGSVEEIIYQTWPAEEAAYAVQVAACESGLGADIYNESSGAYGIFQMLPSTAAGMGVDYSALADPYYASVTAAQLQDAYGWGQWVCAY